MSKKNKNTSKFLSYVLRHHPEKLGITLDENGWTSVAILLEKINDGNYSLSMEELEDIVATNNKKRFAFNEDKTNIRASQGHSVSIDLGIASKQPPEYVYHGTVEKFIESIQNKGLIKGSRQHVHLSADKETAINVGSRRGKPIILTIRSGEMHQENYAFYQSENGVWLTDEVPTKFIEFNS
ncbi:RNA 2'-phosphotransferase [Kordia sp. YSTF-M3]|uniref:Probable RNA 2'-phosphotransferase n=1 Tax=Kordia aestuariivivens TaxID=2759037 RepID=A0ABR7Q6G9_9FLAO|nr:RNA 2'-phosphotransferase [Kordia aestuariivivens]MBC8754160.1 RNA 2'-phosphotransferase [Kordia aestuariivivens]